MKKNLLFLLVTLLISGCSGGDKAGCDFDIPGQIQQQQSVQQTKGDAVSNYFDSLYSLLESVITYAESSGKTFIYGTVFPEIGALENMDIVDKDNTPIKFETLDYGTKLMVASQICSCFQNQIKNKMKIISGIEERYRILLPLMQNFAGTVISLCNDNVSANTLANTLEKFANDNDILNAIKSLRHYHIVDMGPVDPPLIGIDEYKQNLVGRAKRGDLCVIMPIYGSATIINLTKELFGIENLNFHTFGHCGSFFQDVTAGITENDSIIWSAAYHGIGFEPVSAWQQSSYVLRVHKLRFHLDTDGKKVAEVEKVPLTDSQIDSYESELRSCSNASFITYNPLVDCRDWIFTKYYIPERFSCSGLIWYCAKNAYNIDLSSPQLPTVMPINIMISPYTDIIVCMEAGKPLEPCM